jgi:transcriptional regulator of acetoin/glycerol metabolism
MYRQGMDITEAGRALDDYRQRSEGLDAERDQLIRDARAAGMNIRQIHVRSGIARSTIYRVLGLETERDETEGSEQ